MMITLPLCLPPLPRRRRLLLPFFLYVVVLLFLHLHLLLIVFAFVLVLVLLASLTCTLDLLVPVLCYTQVVQIEKSNKSISESDRVMALVTWFSV